MPDDNEQILFRLKAWLLPGAGALLGLLLNMQVSDAVAELRDTRQQMQQMITRSEVASAQVEYLTQRVVNLESARKEAGEVHNQIEGRLNSLEQRAAIHDEFINAYKHK